MSRETSPLLDRMVFVVGARRSGTKWIQRMLAAHPEVAMIRGETGLFTHGLGQLTERFQHGAIGSARTGKVFMDRGALLDALRVFCDSVFTGLLDSLGPGRRYLVERTPFHVHALALIGDIYPDARVIHIIRDGRDVARSLLSQSWGPETMREAAEEWRASVTDGRAAGVGLAHYTEVKYESILADPRREIARLLGWLDLDASEAVLASAVDEGTVPYDVDALAPRIGSGKWAESFTRHELDEFLDVAGPLLEELGYAERGSGPTIPWSSPESGRPARNSGVITRSGAAVRRVISAAVRRPEPLPRQVQRELDDAMEVVDRFLDSVVRGLTVGDDGIFDPLVRIRIVDRDGVWEGRGAPAVERFRAKLGDDPAYGGRQVLGDVYPGLPTYVVVTRYELAGGITSDRVLAIGSANGRITGLAYYRLDDNGP